MEAKSIERKMMKLVEEMELALMQKKRRRKHLWEVGEEDQSVEVMELLHLLVKQRAMELISLMQNATIAAIRCEFHSKAPIVMVARLRQRFCRQCNRFHDLGEFDEAKRSCRRRLAGHNEHSRKCSAESCNMRDAAAKATTQNKGSAGQLMTEEKSSTSD